MKINAIKSLVENHSLSTLQEQIEHLENEAEPTVEIEGTDEGEKFTHVLGAIWIHEQMLENSTDFKTELRNFTQRVRGSIS